MLLFIKDSFSMNIFLGRSLCVVMITMSFSYAAIEKKRRESSPCQVVDRSVVTPSPTLEKLAADHDKKVAIKLEVAEKALSFAITCGCSADMIDSLMKNIEKQTSDHVILDQIKKDAKELYQKQSPAFLALQAASKRSSFSGEGRAFFCKELDKIKKAPFAQLPELVDEIGENIEHWNKKSRR